MKNAEKTVTTITIKTSDEKAITEILDLIKKYGDSVTSKITRVTKTVFPK